MSCQAGFVFSVSVLIAVSPPLESRYREHASTGEHHPVRREHRKVVHLANLKRRDSYPHASMLEQEIRGSDQASNNAAGVCLCSRVPKSVRPDQEVRFQWFLQMRSPRLLPQTSAVSERCNPNWPLSERPVLIIQEGVFPLWPISRCASASTSCSPSSTSSA